MAAGNIEVMNDIAFTVQIHLHPRCRRRAQAEPDAALGSFTARLHPRFHDALADRLFVGESGDVIDRVVHDAI